MGSGKVRHLIAAAACGAVAASAGELRAREEVRLTAGMVIDRSVTVRPGVYRLRSADLKTPAIAVRGENITVDFSGAQLVGSADDADPDTFAGVGIAIDGGANVTLKGGTVRGYKVAVLARNSPGLHLTRNDLSYNWKERLFSGIEKESLLDWMSYHQNEKDEWLRYGAAIYLTDCDRAEIDHNTAVQGQNGLMATRSKALKIWNNTFQFLSAIGVGLYRVTDSQIMHNRIDWCVRGYSHGFYNRGQDSAGLLMYEQSSNNVVAFNSVTHGGDGLFLWAGQTTMDTGQGGANDNVFYRNDFSHAPTNGIEATFSRNKFIENRVEECWHGVWGGYSYDSLWQKNRFVRNTEGMAIEHGQNNVIAANTFEDNAVAIRLWQNATQDPNWGYPKHRDTRSHGYKVLGNVFSRNKTDVDIKDTADVEQSPEPPADIAVTTPAPMRGGMDAMLPAGARRGRDTIIVDEWGPYDWKSPKLWPVLERDGKKGPFYDRLRVLGPEGSWKVVSTSDVAVTPRQGRIPGEIHLEALPADDDRPRDWRVELEYRGAAVVSPRGVVTRAGAPYRFTWSRFVAPLEWQLRFFEYTDDTDPLKQPAAFSRLLAGTPLKTVTLPRFANIDYLSGRNVEDGVPRDRFAVAGESREIRLAGGQYVVRLISDDGARVWMDGKLLIDAWDPHGSRVDTATIGGGRHRFRIEYYEIGGWVELKLDIRKQP
jgi:nitrous oxidase accessory protein NosD